MNRHWFLPAAVAAFLTVTAAANAKPNFTGDWKLNASKSDFGPIPPPDSITQKITHADPELAVSTTQKGAQGEMSFDLKYTTDGKESSNTVGPMQSKSTATWDGDTLLINSTLDMNGTEMKITAKWTLDDDGKTLRQIAHIVSPQGEIDVTQVFEKE